MADQLNWRPDGGIVVHVQPEMLPRYDLPSIAVPIQLDGKPAFHVTLIPKYVMLPYVVAMTNLWPVIAEAAPEPPVAQLSMDWRMGVNEEKGRTSWFVDIVNAEDYRHFVSRLADLIDGMMRAAGYAPFVNAETDRYFHVTIANNKGGDPMYAPLDPQRHG